MRVAGIGFRAGASLASLRAALGGRQVDRLAVLADKADAAALCDLAMETGLPVDAIPRPHLAHIPTPTRSDRIARSFATGSVAEALALAAAGPGAVLISTRNVSCDGLATAAIAQSMKEPR